MHHHPKAAEAQARHSSCTSPDCSLAINMQPAPPPAAARGASRSHNHHHNSSSSSSSGAPRQRYLRLRLRRAGARLVAHSSSSGSSTDAATLLSLPLFPLPTVLHPAQSGTLLVYEPRFLELFRTLQASTAPGSEAHFGHIKLMIHPGAGPPALMQQSVCGMVPLGVCAAVKGIQELGNGQLQVQYQGVRRFRLLSVDSESKPYPIAAAAWLDDDERRGDDAAVQLVDTLEVDVFWLLQQVAKYSQQLAAAAAAAEGGGADGEGVQQQQPVLPDALFRYAPAPRAKQSVAEFLTRAGVPAGSRIATWQRMGSIYGNTAGKQKATQDPYQVLRDQMGKERRQELFSFAAASLLQLGLPEQLALLQCQQTSARLQFVAAAVQPHLQDLLARVSVQRALVD